jgi:hypothetical protein
MEIAISGSALTSRQVVTTNHRGDYRFYSLPPGDYTIAPVQRKGESRTVTVGPAEQKSVPTFSVEPAERAPFPGQAVTQGNGIVAGVVLDERSGEPLPNATVVSRRSARRATTDPNGRFQFEGLGKETYAFLVEGPGYQATSAAEVVVGPDTRVSDVTLKAGRDGSLAGTVRDEVGDPIVGMPVVASLKRLLNFQPMFMGRGSARTDDRGMFEIRSLPIGEYLLCACAGEPLAIDPLLLRQLGPTVPDAATVSRLIDQTVQTFAPTYYPGAARASDSPILFVDHGDSRMGMDITMYGVKPFVVSGRLVDGSGAPATQMQVFLSQDGDLPGAIGVSATGPLTVGMDGTFRFPGVPPGTYALNAYPTTDGQRTPWAHHEVVVADRDIDQLILTAGSGMTVKGRVEFSGSAAKPTAAVMEKTRVSLFPLDISMGMFMSMGNSGTVGYGAPLDANGQFTVDGLPPGRFRVAVTVPDSPWRTIQRVISADAGPLDAVLTVGPGGATDVLVLVSDAPLATLTGTVELAKDRYEAAGFVRVLYFPADPALWLEPERYPDRFGWIGVRLDGSFRQDNLPPGDYFIARGSSFDTEMSARSLERWSKTAARVTLKGAATTTAVVKR